METVTEAINSGLKLAAMVEENAWLCAERGWQANYTLKSGEIIEMAFITASDQNEKAIVLEKPGERHLEPRLVFLEEVQKVEPHW